MHHIQCKCLKIIIYHLYFLSNKKTKLSRRKSRPAFSFVFYNPLEILTIVIRSIPRDSWGGEKKKYYTFHNRLLKITKKNNELKGNSVISIMNQRKKSLFHFEDSPKRKSFSYCLIFCFYFYWFLRSYFPVENVNHEKKKNIWSLLDHLEFFLSLSFFFAKKNNLLLV